MSSARRIAVLDYGMGNRRSVHKALEHVGATVAVTRDPDQLRDADGIVVPGVGAFPLAMRRLHELGLAGRLRERAGAGVPLLGICLGMQLLFDGSEELEPTAGLGLIEGAVTPLQANGLRIPHIGWNEVAFRAPSPLTVGLPEAGCPFYHVHSLAVRPRHDADVIGTTDYGERFATIVAHRNVLGVQFHPEKSSSAGLRMLSAFLELCGAATNSTGTAAAGAGGGGRGR